MELHLIKTFITVAKEGNIRKTSQKLYISKPSVSAHIKTLEEKLGLHLFKRTFKGMELTKKARQTHMEFSFK